MSSVAALIFLPAEPTYLPFDYWVPCSKQSVWRTGEATFNSITYCWWLKSCTTWDVENPRKYWAKLPTSTGAGSLPTVSWHYMIKMHLDDSQIFMSWKLEINRHARPSAKSTQLAIVGLHGRYLLHLSWSILVPYKSLQSTNIFIFAYLCSRFLGF